MADIDVTFATNADAAAASIDRGAESTRRAVGASEGFAKAQEKVSNVSANTIKALRGIGLAAGLAGAEFGGAIGKVAGLATAGLSVAGPWGAAIGASIGIVSAALKEMNGDAEESAKRLEKLRESLARNALAQVAATKAVAAEGMALNSKFGSEIRANIHETGTIQGSEKSSTERDLLSRGMSPAEAKQKADALERYGNNGGMFKNALPEANLGAYQKSVIENLNVADSAAEKKERDQKFDLALGEYSEAIQNTAKNTSDTVDELKKLNKEGIKLKEDISAEEKKLKPTRSGTHWSWTGWFGESISE